MNQPINFLPWRQRRRNACLRFWGVMFVASSLLAFASVLSGYIADRTNIQVNAVLGDAENQMTTALVAAKPRFQQRQEKQQQLFAQNILREQTRRWQPELENLALSVPVQVWFTALDFQRDTLELAGKALTLSALAAFEASLRKMPAFQISRTGATQQDAQGYWQFHYSLIRSEAHDRSL